MASKVRLLFSNSKLPLSPLIRAVTALQTGKPAQWSHVALVITDEANLTNSSLIIESTLSHGGVNLATAIDFKKRAKNWILVELEQEVEDFELMVAIAKSKLGKPYDYTGILGLGVNRDWQENDMWFCSEDVADTLKRSGLQLTGLLNVHSVFPQTCFDWKHKVLDRSVF